LYKLFNVANVLQQRLTVRQLTSSHLHHITLITTGTGGQNWWCHCYLRSTVQRSRVG